MPTAVESEISQMLKEGNDPTLVADELVRRWERHLLEPGEQLDCARFLIASGQYIRFFEQVIRLTDDNQPLPWTEFAEAIGRSRIEVRPEDIDAIFAGATEQSQIFSLVQSKQLDVWDRRFATLRAESLDARLREISSRKQSLRERLDFMRSQRLASEEAKVLDEIQLLFPNDPQFANEKEAFQIRWANEVISASGHSQTDISEDLLWKSEHLPADLNEVRGAIVTRARELIAKNPQTAYDLAIAMQFMDLNHDALELLSQTSRPTEPGRARSTDWLRLELMIRARQFVDVLDYSAQIEIIYANEPEAAFAVVYARARALWGLGQHEMAIDLLSSLVRIRPNYRSASSLLMDWNEKGGRQ